LRWARPGLDRADKPLIVVNREIESASREAPRPMQASAELLRRLQTAVLWTTTRVGSFILLQQPIPSRFDLVGPERAEPD
jgi:hypothetical protein